MSIQTPKDAKAGQRTRPARNTNVAVAGLHGLRRVRNSNAWRARSWR